MALKKDTFTSTPTRRLQRLRVDVPVRIIVSQHDKVKIVDARFRDMSDEGVAVYGGVELKLDTEVNVEFTPPFNSPPLRVRAVVRNRRGYVYGLEFLPRDAHEERVVTTLRGLLLPTGHPVPGTPADRK